MLIHSNPNNMNSIVYHFIIVRYSMKTSYWYFPRATASHLYNMTGRGEKLQQLHCYHPFSDSLDIYLTKNHYENYSPKMVPITKIWGSGSWTIMALCTVIILGKINHGPIPSLKIEKKEQDRVSSLYINLYIGKIKLIGQYAPSIYWRELIQALYPSCILEEHKNIFPKSFWFEWYGRLVSIGCVSLQHFILHTSCGPFWEKKIDRAIILHVTGWLSADMECGFLVPWRLEEAGELAGQRHWAASVLSRLSGRVVKQEIMTHYLYTSMCENCVR